MIIGNRQFQDSGKTYIMGILNVTPDSFSDGGKWNGIGLALKRVEQMLEEGMDVLDIGGESTRPGYVQISPEEEIARVVPIIRAMKKNFDIPVSLDTYKARVAQAGIEAGADLINDIWGLKYDNKIADVISKNKVCCCLMHNRNDTNYTDFMQDVAADLADSIYLAKKAGIGDDKIILDPGVGFAKTYEQNLEAIASLAELKVLGYPLLLGTSRKSVIGLTLDLSPEERIEGTLVTTAHAVWQGCMFVRVHDIKENARAIRMAEALMR